MAHPACACCRPKVLCTDKTGTLTEGVVSLEGAYDPYGAPSETRKRVSVAIERGGNNELICKGAFLGVVDVCSTLAGGKVLDATERVHLERLYEKWSTNGVRVLAHYPQ